MTKRKAPSSKVKRGKLTEQAHKSVRRTPMTAAEIERGLDDLAAETELDPAGFIWAAFPWGEPGVLKNQRPRKWLLEVCESIRKKLLANVEREADAWQVVQEATASGHGIGKSSGMAMLLTWAISTRHTRGVVTANTDTQLRTKTWTELVKWHNLSIFRHRFTITATCIKHKDDDTWRIDAIPWSAHNTEAFAGLHNLGERIFLGFDEASAIADLVWETAEGALTDAGTQIIWVCWGNPTRSRGRFRDCFTKIHERDLWSARCIDSRDVEGTNKDRIERWRVIHGEDSQFFKVRVKGEFVEAEANQLIALQWIADARMRGYEFKADGSTPRRRLSVDVASGGEDSSVFTRVDHYDSVRHLVKQVEASYGVARGATESAKAAKTMYESMLIGAPGPCDIVVDAVGVGDGCAGNLIDDGLPVIAHKGGAQATDPKRFRNARVHCYYLLRNDLRDGCAAISPDALPDEESWIEFEEQLCSVRTKPGTEKLEDLETKEEMMRRGVKSPDRGDSYAIQYSGRAATRLASQSGSTQAPLVMEQTFRSDW